ncbi:ABC transporter permease [Aliiroseovarius sediminis]|uniref:ABC transporter permease n=1 Tax=Aliiroseovarius sediminis TaxID=2925839 RepID=UPI001F5AC483|nr:ABC transporter permease [Aliiroseovarius sediminis]MCI2393847.1 ABC transporter permease [Aliiroseovarius sediminis]
MIRACLSALMSHWRRNPLQLFAYLAGLALATALWSGVQAINAEARASYDAAEATLGEAQFDRLMPRQGASVSQDTYLALRRSGWLVSPVIEGRLGAVRVVGIDPITSPTGLGALNADGPLALDFTGPVQLFANAQTARDLGAGVDVTRTPDIAPGIAIGDVGMVQRLLDRDDLSYLTVAPEQPLGRLDLSTVAPNLRLQPAQQGTSVGQLTDSFHLNLTAFGLLSFAVGLFIVHSTIGLAFEQRRAMIRTLRSLGVPLRTLVLLITGEMLGLATIGAVIGVVLGYLIAAVLLPDVAATLRGLYGADISGALQLRAEWWLSGLLIAVLGTAFALAGRLWQIARMPLLASARPRAWIMASGTRLRLQAFGAIALLTAALVLAVFGQGLMAGFVLLGCLLIGAALLLPVLFEWGLSQVQALAKGPVWGWFWADTRQQLPGLSLALMALLLAVSANIGVSTMVSSFRTTFVAFLDQRLAPELFVQVDNAADSARLDAFLTQNATEVLPLLSTEAQIAGQLTDLFGVRVEQTYRDNWAFLDATDAPWDAVDAGAAVVVNEQLARRADLWVGDGVQIAPDLSLPIAAVVGDYGNPHGQVVLSERVFHRLHPGLSPLQFGVRTDDADQLRQQITARLNIPDSAMINQAAIKALSLEVFERTFTVTAALNVLTLLVAGFAILMTLLTLADLRLPQLAPVWALGLTRQKLGWFELLRAIALAALVFLCAIPLGLALAWVLLTIINTEAFGWQLPMYLFPADYLKLGGYALVAAFLAALWPALRMMRTRPSTLLKVFANEA